MLAYNYLSGEPITGMSEGRPLVVRTPDSRLTLANFMRTQLYAAYGTLSLGMNVLRGEGVKLDSMFAHGGMFRTAGVAQRFLAAAIGAPVSVGDTASEGGAWGIAVLAEYLRSGAGERLSDYLDAPGVRGRQARRRGTRPRRCHGLRRMAQALLGRSGDRAGGDGGDPLAGRPPVAAAPRTLPISSFNP